MIDNIRAQMMAALKSNDTVKKSILRVLMGEMQRANATTESQAINIIKKLVENNKEAIGILDKQQVHNEAETRQVLVAEIAILGTFLPTYLTEAEIATELQAIVEQIKGAKSDGMAMGVSMNFLKGKSVEGNAVKRVIEEMRKVA